MKVSTRPYQLIDNAEIPLSDGVVLSAQIWLPEDATLNPVPGVFEYLPYRKRDGTWRRDALNHPYFAAQGYGCVRVDMRGSGDSGGLLLGEYLKQEQDDGLEVIQWIADQPWCSGSVGMIGISWGGFNGLQIAARHPPALKAVISICTTDDRYNNDTHYKGGCMLLDNFLWGATMLALSCTPPDPAIVGDEWRDMWRKRIDSGGFFTENWHRHQRRDEFWKHGSICEDYSSIQCPVYLVGGWSDALTTSIFSMMDRLECPKKALVGPWAHAYPNFAFPGPQIGFLQESVRWWDKWLKGTETGIMDEPPVRCFLQDPARPQTQYKERSGRWIAEAAWPSKGLKIQTCTLHPGRLSLVEAASCEKLTICSPQTEGFSSGRWLIYGIGPDAPSDQRQDAGGALVFDSEPLEQTLNVLGAPVVKLRIASDRPVAFVAAVLSEVLPDGAATRVSYNLLNLSHRNSHLDLEEVVPGRFYDVVVNLNEIGQGFGAGNRLRLTLSSTYFPTVWPSPEIVTLTVDCAHSSVDLPVRPNSSLDKELKPFRPAFSCDPQGPKTLRGGKATSKITQDLESGEVSIEYVDDRGFVMNEENGWCWGGKEVSVCTVHPEDPLSARIDQIFSKEYKRDGMPLAVVEGWNKMRVTKTSFIITAHLNAWEDNEKVYERDYDTVIPRDNL